MASPPVLSPYVRPFLAPGSPSGRRLYDNGVTGQVERLGPLEEAIACALWPTDADADDADAGAALAALAAAHPEPLFRLALHALYDAGLLFDSRAGCEAALDAARAAALPDVPLIDQIELTSFCPMRCRFCPRGVPGRMQRPSGFMEFSLYLRLLDQLNPGQAEYRPLELHHLGESLLHPRVADFVAAASARGLPTEMSVNPALLTPPLMRRLLDAGIGRLVVSLDGIDDATLVQIRGPAARYTRAEPHLDALLAEVARRGAAAPRIVIQMIGLHANRHQRQAFLDRWGRTGLPAVQAYVKDLDGDDPDLGRPAGTPLRALCGYPFRSVVVLWDGRVVPCCRDDDARLVLGDLSHQTLAEIWHGEAATALRARHAGSGEFPAGHLCHGCAWSRAAFAADAPARHPDRARDAPLQW